MKSKIQVTEMKYLRKVDGVTRMERIGSDHIRAELLESVHARIEKKLLAW